MNVEARLAALERQVAELQEGGADSEALQPSYLTFDPATGQVSADFSGSLDLPENPSSQAWQAGHAVTWRDSGRTIREWIQGAFPIGGGGSHVLVIGAGGQVRTLLADDGTSNFAQGNVPTEVSFGNVTVPFAAQTSVSTSPLHGLLKTPTAVVVTAQAIIGTLTGHADTFTSTDFRLTLTSSAAITGSFSASWVAFAQLP